MYTNFYNLKEKPFNLTPSSRFLYLGESHKEALASLTYGVVERKGFILLTGEVGTGKTTMVKALLNNLDDTVRYVHLSNPLFSPKDLMNYLGFAALKKGVHFKSKAEFILEFEEFLQQCLRDQKIFVLIIDEAQKLSFELLEEIRLLSNMETADEKLINIFMVGQPELNEKLSHPECRPILQRISIRHHISPLNLEETGGYISTRLKVAGAEDGEKIFSKSVVKAIHHSSRGYPRVINILADNVLLLGYSKGKREITPAMIDECYGDMKLDNSFPETNHKVLEHHEINRVEQVRTGGRYWKWLVALFFTTAFVASAISQSGQKFFGRLAGLIPFSIQTPFREAPKARMPVKEIDRKTNIIAEYRAERVVPAGDQTDERKADPVDVIPMVKQIKSDPVDVIPPEEPKKMAGTPRAENKEIWKTVIVKQGDYFSKLVADVYGRASENNLKLVEKHNPQIKNINTIEVGQKIIFPPLSESDQGQTFTVHIASFKPFEDARTLSQELMKEGYRVNIIPVANPKKGKIFRVVLGSFRSQQEAEDYAAEILKKSVSDYAEAMRMEMR